MSIALYKLEVAAGIAIHLSSQRRRRSTHVGILENNRNGNVSADASVLVDHSSRLKGKSMTNQPQTNHSLKRDARIWSGLTGKKHTAALRDLDTPVLSGVLGPRVKMTDVERVLDENPDLGDGGLGRESFIGPDDRLDVGDPHEFLVDVAKCIELLRALTSPDSAKHRDTELVSSYTLKHLAEDLFKSYISNGRMVFAAYVLALPTGIYEGGPNVDIEVDAGYFEYVSRFRRTGAEELRFHHHRPENWDAFVCEVLQREPSDYESDPRYLSYYPEPGEFPFFDWMVDQYNEDRIDRIGHLLKDYMYAVSISDDPIVRNPEELMELLEPYPDVEVAAQTLIAEWDAHVAS